MSFHVRIQLIFVGECFQAEQTAVGLLCSVCPHVLLQGELPGEALVAGGTVVRPPLPVGHPVQL